MTLILDFAFLAMLVWFASYLAFRMALQSFVTVRGVSMGWGFAALPVGAALMLLGVLATGWREFVGKPGQIDDSEST